MMKLNSEWALRLAVAAVLTTFTGYAAAEVPSQSLRLVSADAQLNQQIDSKTATSGEQITAKLTSNVTTADGTKIDRGAELIGEVSGVEASAHHGPAHISIVFNEARLKDGRQIPVRAVLLGAYPPEDDDNGTAADPMSLQPHFIPADQKIDQEAGILSHVSLHSNAGGQSSGNFVSSDRDIHLGRGTQLQFALAPRSSTNLMSGAE
ncbi:hypothetical protein [Paracidobacterium acidisoli]|uniref:Uncharacterized protein n=1 Tax=Paracidobacterium acidisoli TaxID=2303751 RepID=A0A372INE2_9BACT|nr:hypothetical protein [Paracidobacterium acidisoli]MBT9332099.1 hypothetical protein [Paracidobacterium acidisoli]